MRTFHTGGVAGGDITQGLPRVEELFEARKPKGLAEICEADGTVISIEARKDNKTEVRVRGEEEDRTYIIPYGARINVKEGDQVFAGGQITRGPLNPHDILRLNGVEGVYQYLLKEVQRVYKQQGVDINDKHVEVIVSQMLSKYKIEDAGDTDLLPGGLYGKFEIEEANAKALEEGGEPCVPKRILLGITKASLATNSFLSAASFQETTRVLTDAAINAEIMENFERQQAEEAARAAEEERAFLEMQEQAESEAQEAEAADITLYNGDDEEASEAAETAEANTLEADAAEGNDAEEATREEE